MTKKGDILVYAEHLEEDDESCLMIALEDECISAKVPMVKTQELNTDLPYPPVNFFEARWYKIVGHAKTSDTRESIVEKYLQKPLKNSS